MPLVFTYKSYRLTDPVFIQSLPQTVLIHRRVNILCTFINARVIKRFSGKGPDKISKVIAETTSKGSSSSSSINSLNHRPSTGPVSNTSANISTKTSPKESLTSSPSNVESYKEKSSLDTTGALTAPVQSIKDKVVNVPAGGNESIIRSTYNYFTKTNEDNDIAKSSNIDPIDPEISLVKDKEIEENEDVSQVEEVPYLETDEYRSGKDIPSCTYAMYETKDLHHGKQHEETHKVVIRTSSNTLPTGIAIGTSAYKNKNTGEPFITISPTNFEGQNKNQQLAPFEKPRVYDHEDFEKFPHYQKGTSMINQSNVKPIIEGIDRNSRTKPHETRYKKENSATLTEDGRDIDNVD